MAKQDKLAAGPSWPLPKTITHPEHHHTLNHLHQVSSFYATLAAWGKEAAQQAIASQCQRDLNSLAKKAVIRLDTSVKRGVCRQCSVPAIQGITRTTRNKASGPHGHVVQNTCSICGFTRRMPAPYELPSAERHDAVPYRIAQRQRRKVARVVKALLRDDHPTSAKSPRLSRRQRSHVRKQRLSSPDPPQIVDNTALSRIHLPPYSDRVKGSGWDRSLLHLQDHANQLPDAELTQYSRTALAFLNQASRSRGDHIVVCGIGKNGAVGPPTL